MTISAAIPSILAVWLAFGLAACGDNVGSATSSENAPIRGLPSDAADISYAYLSPNSMYEFNTAEASFRTWVAGQTRPVMGPIQQKDTMILRFNPSTKTTELVSVRDALVSEWTGTQSDEGQYVVYDTQRKRAFFWYHSR